MQHQDLACGFDMEELCEPVLVDLDRLRSGGGDGSIDAGCRRIAFSSDLLSLNLLID